MVFSEQTTIMGFIKDIEVILKEQLRKFPYNTMGNFLKFYEDFKQQDTLSLVPFFVHYKPIVLQKSLSCVGLSCCLISAILKSHIVRNFPNLKFCLFRVSCEECISELDLVCLSSPKPEALKEHVLVAIKIKLENREGVILLDPGYHIGIPIIIMADKQYPHTGWFVQSQTVKSKKEYNYILHPSLKYVNWTVRETRGGNTEVIENLIYVGSEYVTHVSVSEKRNLVYNFHTLVARDGNSAVAGLYCSFGDNARYTIFYRNEVGERVECKIPMSYFMESQLNPNYELAISICSVQLKSNLQFLKNMMRNVVQANMDAEFMPVMLQINKKLDK
ncbi:uncharacterized protein LOC106475093 [Limulus polyphemus]|uniref:Uncharacterized protein LOC106475093 n=1 Tax=Limulus polyphemus TaxID=6850 RepID=A0ABM1BYT5_LIMPO|nr:uncharacterized protein LOC106475093 [Limulus polyphemus]XP_022235010.1 uncharacterized protein LOC106475093 [Limulus polyphemus]